MNRLREFRIVPQIAGSMAAAVEQLRIREDEVLVGCDLFRAAEGAAKDAFDGVAFVKAQGKKGGSIAAILQQALVSNAVIIIVILNFWPSLPK